MFSCLFILLCSSTWPAILDYPVSFCEQFHRHVGHCSILFFLRPLRSEWNRLFHIRPTPPIHPCLKLEFNWISNTIKSHLTRSEKRIPKQSVVLESGNEFLTFDRKTGSILLKFFNFPGTDCQWIRADYCSSFPFKKHIWSIPNKDDNPVLCHDVIIRLIPISAASGQVNESVQSI